MPESTTLERSVCFAVYSAMHATLGLYRELLAPWGLTYQQAMVLAAVWELEPLSPGELADALRLDSSSVTGLLNRMEQRELVARTIDATDRRKVSIRSTALSHEIRSELSWVEDCIASAIGLDRDTSSDLVAGMHRLRTNILSYTPPAPATVSHNKEKQSWNSTTSA
ncbi:MAG: MarR family transcriptional regulator [Microbacterium sp.]|nr:MarR family transcriptional regulator [Microbacterium sp.]